MTDELRDARERGWFHIDNVIVDEYLPRIGVTAFAVYACIVRHADASRDAFPSYTKLQKEVRTGRHQVAEAIKKIVDAGLVTITPGKRSANVYHIVNVSTGAAPTLVPQRNQFPSGTDTSSAEEPVDVATSSAPAPTLVPQRNLTRAIPPRPPYKEELIKQTRPKEQDPSPMHTERENLPARAHARFSPAHPSLSDEQYAECAAMGLTRAQVETGTAQWADKRIVKGVASDDWARDHRTFMRSYAELLPDRTRGSPNGANGHTPMSGGMGPYRVPESEMTPRELAWRYATDEERAMGEKAFFAAYNARTGGHET
jgi:hypothetical protein